jgi:hypothetical protein
MPFRRRSLQPLGAGTSTRTHKAIAMLLGAVALTACREVPVVRHGPVQTRLVSRTYAMPTQTLRERILHEFATARSTLPDPFRRLRARELTPPWYSPDWLAGFVDPGGFLADYKRMRPAETANDLLLQDPTGDMYWLSEYVTDTGPVKFHCGLILHFAERAPGATDVQVFETVPTVWLGEHWAMAMHGVGFGRFDDIRFVEPTVKDRLDVLELVDRIFNR